ncbi:MAG: BON domain-containing protein, partial [Terriglobales bacterium]
AVGHSVVLHGYVDDEAERERLICAIQAMEGVGAVADQQLRVRGELPTEAGPGSSAAPAATPQTELQIVPGTGVLESSAPAASQGAAGPARPRRSP